VQRGRIVLIFVAAAALLGGGLYFLFGMFLPGRARHGAQAEIERWELRLDKARACLVGDTPSSPDFGEALAIHALGNEVDRRTCTPAISDLARNATEDTGVPKVEAAWREVDSAVSGVASAFASHLVPGELRKQKTLDPLPGAIDKLIEAHLALRDAAGMDPPPPRPGNPLPEATIVPVALGPHQLPGFSGWLRPSAGGLVALLERDATATADDPRFQIVFVPGKAPTVAPMKSEVRPSVTDPAWGAGPKDGGIASGAIGPTGVIEPAASLPPIRDANPFVLFTVGTATDGVVAYSPGEAKLPVARVVLARIANGALAAEPAHDAAEFAFALDPPGRGLLAWSNTAGALQASIVRPGTPTKIVDLGSGHAGQSCLTATKAWVSSDDQFISFDDAGATPHVLPNHLLVGCDATSVLLRRAGHRYSVCTETCRIAELEAKPDALPALVGGKVIAVATNQKVLAVWREKQPPRYFRLPAPLDPKLVHATAEVIDVIGASGGKLVIARVRP